jgi:hypothetical protein
MIDERLINPFKVPTEEELPHVTNGTTNWTEYCYFLGYCGQSRTGATIHIGRHSIDTRIWRGTLGIYLPDGDLLVAKYFGRDGSDRGPGAGPLQVRCIEPMRLWSVEFDGLAERVTRPAIMNAVHKDSPAELARFYLLFEAAAPLWDLGRSNMAQQMILITDEKVSIGQKESHLHHWEQICWVRGEVSVGGKTYPVNGTGVRDHSHGPRDYTAILGNHWLNVVFPSGKAMMLQATRVGDNFIRGGYIFRNDGSPLEVVKLLEHPFVGDKDTAHKSIAADPLTDPRCKSLGWVIQTKRGKEEITGELLHAMGTTYLKPNYELVGTDIARVNGGSQLSESPCVYKWDGETGLGMAERITLMEHLRPTI